MEFIYKISDMEEVYSYITHYVDGYGFSGVYLDKNNNLNLIYAPERKNEDLVSLRVSREFVIKHKEELNAGGGIKAMLPFAITENYENFFQVPVRFLDDKPFTMECIKLAENGAKQAKTDEKTK